MPTATEATIGRRELGRATLARQLLLERSPLDCVAAVSALAGMQAQEPRPPFVGLWSRLRDFRAEALLGDLRAGTIVRGPLFRATLHLVSAPDWSLFRPPSQPVLTRALRGLGGRAEGIDVEAVARAGRKLLAGGPLSAGELRARLAEAFPAAEDRVLAYAVRTHVPVTIVATDDAFGFPRDPRFALAEPAPPHGSLEQVVTRYLAAFGPASVADAQEWSGLSALASTFEALREGLVTFTDERGRELFDLPDAPRPAASTPAPARYLPEFDNLVLAHADRARVIAVEHRPHLTTKNLRVRAVALHDGEACATWSVKRTAKAATLELTPFAPLAAGAREELEAEGLELLRANEPAAAKHAVAFAAPVGGD